MSWRGRITILVPFVVVVVGVAIAWLVRDWKVGAASTGAVALAAVVATLLQRELERYRERAERAPVPLDVLERELLERWRAAARGEVIELRTSADGQLENMVREGEVPELRARVDAGRPRVRVRKQTLAWSEITRRWDRSPGRLVILGDPGYGKTVAALTLIKHINRHSAPGAPVAELFRLADWQRWRGEHPDEPLAAWMADELALTCKRRRMTAKIARQLIDAELVLPVFDGLDEIANLDDRRACVRAINGYGERVRPHRPFVLTSRAREYSELAPSWVRGDQRLVLVGLQPDQIGETLAASPLTVGPAWDIVRKRQASGDAKINQLLRSPLHLAMALQVYADRDPSELFDRQPDEARQRLWELSLATHADSYDGASAEQIRAWLAWLAAGLQRTNRQRFMLHELYLLDPHRDANLRAFRVVLGAGVGLVHLLIVALLVGPVVGIVVGVLAGLAPVDPAPSVRAERVWSKRVRYAISALPRHMLVALVVGPFSGLVGGLFFGRAGGLVFGVFVGLGAGMASFIIHLLEAEVISAQPPRRYDRAGPDAVVVASRANGLMVGRTFVLVSWLGSALILGVGVVGLGVELTAVLVFWLIFGLIFGLFAGLNAALTNGLSAWLYHHWLRWRLARDGVLPTRLPDFLAWCTDEERGWLRISDAYEFRHRELLDHLAPSRAAD